MAQAVPEGWYADPQDGTPGAQSWGYGHLWTAHTRHPHPVPPHAATAATADAPPAGPGPAPQVAHPSTPRQLADGTPLADLGPRLAAYGIDVALVFVAVAVPVGVLAAVLEMGEPVGVADLTGFFLGAPVRALALAGAWALYQLFFLTRGRPTLGKRWLRLRGRGSGDALWVLAVTTC